MFREFVFVREENVCRTACRKEHRGDIFPAGAGRRFSSTGALPKRRRAPYLSPTVRKLSPTPNLQESKSPFRELAAYRSESKAGTRFRRNSRTHSGRRRIRRRPTAGMK